MKNTRLRKLLTPFNLQTLYSLQAQSKELTNRRKLIQETARRSPHRIQHVCLAYWTTYNQIQMFVLVVH